jgi:type 1 fimbria pilin
MMMKKLFFTVALAVMAMFAMSTAASASYTSASGTAVTATGAITLRGNIVSTTCNLTLSGSITGRTTANVTRGVASCPSPVTMTISTPFTKTLLTTSGVLAYQWSAGVTRVVLNTGVGIVCDYDVTLAGSFARGNPTVLSLGGALQVVRLVSGGGFCSTNPTITGSLSLNTATS